MCQQNDYFKDFIAPRGLLVVPDWQKLVKLVAHVILSLQYLSNFQRC